MSYVMLYNIHKIWTNMLQIECGAVVDTLLCLEDMVLYRVCSQACSLLKCLWTWASNSLTLITTTPPSSEVTCSAVRNTRQLGSLLSPWWAQCVRGLPLPLADQLTLMLLSGDLTNCIEWQLWKLSSRRNAITSCIFLAYGHILYSQVSNTVQH